MQGKKFPKSVIHVSDNRNNIIAELIPKRFSDPGIIMKQKRRWYTRDPHNHA